MFCPKCGNADQKENTFCRFCGVFLPDFNEIQSKAIKPEDHLKASLVLNFMTAVVSLTLAVLLFTFFLGDDSTHPLIFITAGFLTAMFFWQAQSVWRTVMLKKQFPKREVKTENFEQTPQIKPAKTRELLNEADLSSAVPASVVEHTTRKLKIKR